MTKAILKQTAIDTALANIQGIFRLVKRILLQLYDEKKTFPCFKVRHKDRKREKRSKWEHKDVKVTIEKR